MISEEIKNAIWDEKHNLLKELVSKAKKRDYPEIIDNIDMYKSWMQRNLIDRETAFDDVLIKMQGRV